MRDPNSVTHQVREQSAGGPLAALKLLELLAGVFVAAALAWWQIGRGLGIAQELLAGGNWPDRWGICSTLILAAVGASFAVSLSVIAVLVSNRLTAVAAVVLLFVPMALFDSGKSIAQALWVWWYLAPLALWILLVLLGLRLAIARRLQWNALVLMLRANLLVFLVIWFLAPAMVRCALWDREDHLQPRALRPLATRLTEKTGPEFRSALLAALPQTPAPEAPIMDEMVEAEESTEEPPAVSPVPSPNVSPEESRPINPDLALLEREAEIPPPRLDPIPADENLTQPEPGAPQASPEAVREIEIPVTPLEATFEPLFIVPDDIEMERRYEELLGPPPIPTQMKGDRGKESATPASGESVKAGGDPLALGLWHLVSTQGEGVGEVHGLLPRVAAISLWLALVWLVPLSLIIAFVCWGVLWLLVALKVVRRVNVRAETSIFTLRRVRRFADPDGPEL